MKIKILSLPKHNFADGGDTGNGVTTFSGLKHGQFGLDGIPQGIASDGLPNYVQGGGFDKNGNPIKGEVKYKDYIYGELKITKKLADKFNLPEKWIGLKYQEAADIAQQESKDRPNDPISLTTLNEWMTRLQGAQEEQKYIRDTREAAKALDSMSDEKKAALLSSLEQPMAQQEGIDLSQPIYAKGGKIYIKPENRGKFTASAKRAGMSVQEFARHVLANKEDYSSTQVKRANFARNFGGHKHTDGGHLFPIGGGLGAFDYDTNYIINGNPYKTFLDKMSQEQLKVLGVPNNMMSWQPDGKGGNELMAVTNPIEVSEGGTPKTKSVKVQPTTPEDSEGNKLNFNLANLRYAPAIGAQLGAITAALQPKDYTLSNRLEQLASEYKPIGAPHIGGYRKYTPYDINLGDAENLALQAAAINANRGQNRATQGALNTAVIAKSQEANAKRNLAAQQANEANRLAVDTYNLGIDQFNAQRDSQYDQLNQQILANRINLLGQAAQAADASRTAWAANINSTAENAFNQLGNVGKDQWVRNQRDALLTALGAEGIKELMKSAEGRAWLAQNGYYNN